MKTEHFYGLCPHCGKDCQSGYKTTFCWHCDKQFTFSEHIAEVEQKKIYTYFYIDSVETSKNYAHRIASLCDGVSTEDKIQFSNSSEDNYDKAKNIISSERLYGFSCYCSTGYSLTINDLTMPLNMYGKWIEAMLDNCCLVIRVGQSNDPCKFLEAVNDDLINIITKVKHTNPKNLSKGDLKSIESVVM